MKIQGNTIRIESGDTLTKIARHIVRSEHPGIRPDPSEIRAKLRALVKTNGIGDQNRILSGKSLQLPFKGNDGVRTHVGGVHGLREGIRGATALLANTASFAKSSPVPSEKQIMKALGPDSPRREAKITIGRAHVEPAGKPLGHSKPQTQAPAAPQRKEIHIDESVLPDEKLQAKNVG